MIVGEECASPARRAGASTTMCRSLFLVLVSILLDEVLDDESRVVAS